jgi:hypothetical protein
MKIIAVTISLCIASLFPRTLFPQSLSEKELIGTWKNDAADNDTTQLIFFKDHKVMVTYHWGKEVFSFE